MWSVGNKSSFIPATTDAKAGLAKGLERATAAIAKAPVHDWKRAEVDVGKSHWIVDAPGGGRGDRAPASSALDAHIELEQAMAASRKKVSAAGEASDSSAYDSSSSSSSSGSGRRRRKVGKKQKGAKKASSSRKDEKRKKSKKPKRKEERRRKRKRADRESPTQSDAEKDRERRVSAVSGKKLKLKLEGSNRRSAEEERRRREYLHRLNATVDLKLTER